jgi:hypothetical protein
MITLKALWGSRWLVYVLAPFLALGGYRVWLWTHDAGVAAKATAVVVEKVKEKADENADARRKINKAVAKGVRGPDDPNRIKP